MPLYEYQCPRCGERFEVLQRIGEGGEALRCPACGSFPVERQLSAFASTGRASSGSESAAGLARGCRTGFT